ncbi:MAG: CPBP family intramembrane metalloprotease [Flavobacteriales bacterium]|nr:MAG: CPBP family intramembrane metalloprotease [Flavobacteriales bacterium]|tara:strand:- start:2884 stop:3786 length:903 start_codon:yes stop_codon:yes gene_type:complete
MFLWDKSFRLKGFWYYILGSFLIILFNTFAQIPLLSFASWDSITPDSNPMDIFNDISKNLRFFLLLLTFVLTVPGILLVVNKLHDLPIMSIISKRKKIDYNRILFAFTIAGTIISLSVLIGYYLSPENYELNFKLKEFLILTIIAILFVPIQTSVEEIVFRGYLMQGFGHWLNSRFMALFLTSTIFGFLHFFNPEINKLGNSFIILYIISSFTFGIMTLMDEGLELAMGFHAGNNLFIALLLTADWTVFNTDSLLIDISDPKIGLTDFIVPLILYPLILLIFSKKYSWSNWKQKLISKIR